MNELILSPTDSTKIEESLRKNAEMTANLCRASLFTIVLWTQKEVCENLISLLIQKLSLRFPARIVLVTESREASEITVKTAALAKEGVISDFIQLVTPINDDPRTLSIVIPLLLPDLPSFLFLAKPFSPRDPFIQNLVPTFSRFIIDLAYIPSIPLFLEDFNAIPKNLQNRFFEINWTKIKGWRQAFARVFDSPERIATLKKSRFLYIRYRVTSSQDTTSLAALLLQGWIAEKLGWSLKERVTLTNQREKILYHFEDQELTCELEGVFEPDEESDILSLDITSWDEQFFSFTKHPGKNQLQIHISDIEICELPQTLPLETDLGSYRFFRALFYEPHDPQLDQVYALLFTSLVGI